MLIKYFNFIKGHWPQQTALISTQSQSKGNKVISIIESNIKNVLIGTMPINKHITKAKETLIFMIDSLPVDSIVYKYISEHIITPYKLNAKASVHKLNVFKEPWLNLDKSKYSTLEGGTYLFTLLIYEPRAVKTIQNMWVLRQTI